MIVICLFVAIQSFKKLERILKINEFNNYVIIDDFPIDIPINNNIDSKI